MTTSVIPRMIAGLLCSWKLVASLNYTPLVARALVKLHSSTAGDGTGIVCLTCGIALSSRGKLFNHLRGTRCGQGLELHEPEKRLKVALIVGYTCGGESAEDALATCLGESAEELPKTNDAALPRVTLTRATGWRFRSSPFFRYDRCVVSKDKSTFCAFKFLLCLQGLPWRTW